MIAFGSKAFAAALLFVAMVLPGRALTGAEENWSERPYIYVPEKVRGVVYQTNFYAENRENSFKKVRPPAVRLVYLCQVVSSVLGRW